MRSPMKLGKLNLDGKKLFVIAGPCVLENRDTPALIAQTMRRACDELGLPYIFKASFDKANRTSGKSFRGPGLEEGLKQLARIRQQFDVPVLTDVHETSQCGPVAEVCDVLQIPAFLCRQTDLLEAAAAAAIKHNRVVNIKKGQFLAPWDMQKVVDKMAEAGAKDRVMLTERGASFGYNNLVSDMRSIPIMQKTGCPVVMDATHSVQLPGGMGDKSGGQREFAPVMARAAVAAGCDGLFAETHPEPEKALSDGPNMIYLKDMPALLKQLDALFRLVRA
ncbi:MAG: 3-deoxy-8-phosphooctulonate synthase [Planctomycetes bacterium]|nr:3-deoxy-8-phosphooctulonate synthase [Planctomycetota bacterium]MCL4730117.1 3-deoxy-8-phosphooctulonate synthase [Planctomycetota bacterium]